MSPKIEIESEATVIEAVMKALEQDSVMADSARRIWNQAGTWRIKRMEPIWTARGKLMPLHIARLSKERR